WRKRISSLKNTPPIFEIVWNAAPGIVTSTLLFRLLAAVIPISLLAVTRRIIDSIYQVTTHQQPLSHGFWLLVVFEFVLAGLGIILARLVDFSENVLTERYTN